MGLKLCIIVQKGAFYVEVTLNKLEKLERNKLDTLTFDEKYRVLTYDREI